MLIETPTDIQTIAWEGELVAPESLKDFAFKKTAGTVRPVVTLGRPEIWPVAAALEPQLGKPWVPPLSNAAFWLLRLACTLHPVGRFQEIVEAQQTLSLTPLQPGAPVTSTYAFSLFPERLTAEEQREMNLTLGPKLKFGDITVEGGQAGTRISYRQVFPVIQGYGAGEPEVYWLFKPHRVYPLAGCQFVYAVVAAQTGAGGIRGAVELTVSVDTDFGIIRLGLPREARADLGFTIRPQA